MGGLTRQRKEFALQAFEFTIVRATLGFNNPSMFQGASGKIPTSREIADAAGVSHSTVIRALRHDGKVALATREKICQLAEAMGHRANPFVSAWANHRRRTSTPPALTSLAYLVTMRSLRVWEGSPAMTRFYNGAKARAEALGFNLERHWIADRGIGVSRMNEILLARGIRGLIIGSFSTAHGHLSLDWPKFTAVAQGHTLIRPELHRVANDYSASMAVLLHQLRKHGYRRIGFAVSPAVDTRNRGLWSGVFLNYQLTIEAEGRIPLLRFDQHHPADFISWYNQHRPEVIVSVHRQIEKILRDQGLRVPEDVGLATPDWQPHLRDWAAVDCQSERVGAAAVDLLTQNLCNHAHGLPVHRMTILTEGVYRNGLTLKHQGQIAALPLLPTKTAVWE
jgi:LacI family transcriptional regulator